VLIFRVLALFQAAISRTDPASAELRALPRRDANGQLTFRFSGTLVIEAGTRGGRSAP
jgi:hypothetical protein